MTSVLMDGIDRLAGSDARFLLGVSVDGIHLDSLDIPQIHGIIVSTNNERK